MTVPLYKHAEPEALGALDLPWADAPFRHVAVIPAYDERSSLPGAVASVRQAVGGKQALLIAVINGALDSPPDIHRGNQESVASTWPAVASQLILEMNPPRLHLFQDQWGGTTLLVNRFTHEHLLPAGEGVGLARKIGADIALALLRGGVSGSKWLHMTDADVRVPPDYFARELHFRNRDAQAALPENKGDPAGAVFSFLHHPPTGQDVLGDGLLVYELFLRDYENRLRQAGSPYAFQTIGSLLLLNLEKYAVVRGFPRRQAAEDFYLLNKLAKVGGIRTVTGSPISIAERHSVRVPFGTGASTMKLQQAPFDQPIFYDPEIFIELYQVLMMIAALAQAPSPPSLELALRGFRPDSAKALDHLGFPKAMTAIGTNFPTASQRLRHLHEWFDGFRTMRWIHLLSEKVYPRLTARSRFGAQDLSDEDLRGRLRNALQEQRANVG